MFPFGDSSMDLPLYHQLQLSPHSPKAVADQPNSFYCFPCSPPFAAAAAADASFHLSYQQIGSAAAVIDSPELPVQPLMEQAPAPATDGARKDRHSKIRTAGGMRDRRMRLSLDVGRQFFALQDMLGFDKPSKTLEWLLHKAGPAIKKLTPDDVDGSSAECVEDGGSSSLSVDGKQHNPNPAEQPAKGNNGRSEGKKPAAKSRKAAATTPKPPRKSGNNAHNRAPDKETRAKARERARERTEEKHRMRWVKLASAIDVEAATASAASGRPSADHLSHHHSSSSSMNMPTRAAAAAELEERERCSSALSNRGRMQEITGASDVVLGFGNGSGGGYGGGGGNYYCQEQWELGGVVFQQNSRFY